MNEIILQPCPFCGGVPEILSSGNYWPKEQFRILCKHMCCVQGKFFDSPQEAAEEWNRRKAISVAVTFK